jgi:hypothetical protein
MREIYDPSRCAPANGQGRSRSVTAVVLLERAQAGIRENIDRGDRGREVQFGEAVCSDSACVPRDSSRKTSAGAPSGRTRGQ